MRSLLADFGSTYTKLTLVEDSSILAQAQAFTTVTSNIQAGFIQAETALKAQIKDYSYDSFLACSSAAGGLKMAVIGLVEELTAKAALLAALGAGAKVSQVLSGPLSKKDLKAALALDLDIILLTGGTDGGDTECFLHNANLLANSDLNCPLILAGNHIAVEQSKELFAGKKVYTAANVMPKLGKLNLEPVRQIIRQVFLEEIVKAKGLSEIASLVDLPIIPTPDAVLKALALLAEDQGDLVAVDLGGATTDIYSFAKGDPSSNNVIFKGLPNTYSLRTVEGDIGMRYGAMALVETIGLEVLAQKADLSLAACSRILAQIQADKSYLAETAEEKALDLALASLALELGLKRHCGRLETVYTPLGQMYQQTGKDLKVVDQIVLTGGALVYSQVYRDLAYYESKNQDPLVLVPAKAKIRLDQDYILSAMGLLAQLDPKSSLKILKKHLQGGADA